MKTDYILAMQISGRGGKMPALSKGDSSSGQQAQECRFKWGAKVVDEDHQYRSFFLAGKEYHQYDCVRCRRSEEGSGDWLGKLMELEEADDGQKLCKVQRFVPGSELPPDTAGLTQSPQPKEVFLAAGRTTAVETVNILEGIVKKCRVLCVAEHNFNIVPTTEKVQAADHFFSRAYDGDRKRIVSLENLADSIGAQRVFNKKEWVMEEVHDPVASWSLAKKPPVKRPWEEMPALHDGSALESPCSSSQPLKKPKLFKHLTFPARTGEDPAARTKVVAPASRPLREETPELRSPGSASQPVKKISKDPSLPARTGADPALRSFGGKEKVNPAASKQVEVSEPVTVHRKEKVKDIFSIYVGGSEYMPAADQGRATVEAAKELQKTEARDTAQVQRNVFKVVREPWESSIEKAARDHKVLHLTNLDPQLNAADIEDLLNPFLRVTCEARILHPLSYRHFHSVEALVKFPNPKIAETTVREMQEKCFVMGDRPVAVSLASANPAEQSSRSNRFPGHILLKVKAHEDHKNAVATSHGAQGNTIEFTYGLQWRVLQEQHDVQWRKIASVFFPHALYFLVFPISDIFLCSHHIH